MLPLYGSPLQSALNVCLVKSQLNLFLHSCHMTWTARSLLHRVSGQAHLCQDQAVMVQDVVAAFPEGRLGAEVGDDVYKPVSEIRDLQARRNLLHQPQRIHIAPNVVQQGSCTHADKLERHSGEDKT